jgi:Transmembrane domain of unknown function (DUF3566)
VARAKVVMQPVEADLTSNGSRRSNGSRKKVGKAYPAKLPAVRRYRQTIKKVDLWTVLKISICFYLTALIVFLCAAAMLWWIASAIGFVGQIEDFVGELMNSEDTKFLSWTVLRATTLVGMVGVCLMVVTTVLAAAFYNLFSELIGGIEVTVVEEESNAKR